MQFKTVKNRKDVECYVCGKVIPAKTGAQVFSPLAIGRTFACTEHTEEEITNNIYNKGHGRTGRFQAYNDFIGSSLEDLEKKFDR